MQERMSGGWLRSGRLDRKRHGLIFGRQGDGKSGWCYACGRQLMSHRNVGSAKVIRSHS